MSYDLVGVDGNAFCIIGYVVNAMRHEGFTDSEISSYRDDATALDYSNLIAKSCEMLHACNERCQ